MLRVIHVILFLIVIVVVETVLLYAIEALILLFVLGL
jgi:hypothetical protein